MSYNKSDGSRQYNKEERGGWYCTNPKKHEDLEQHHAADQPHEHRAERNDAEPQRQPHHRTTKPIISFEEYAKPTVTPPKKQQNGCRTVLQIMVFAMLMPLIFAVFIAIFSDDDSDYTDPVVEYYDDDSANVDADDFTLGADISWYTQAESQGHKYYNLQGQEGDCNQVMKDCGLGAVRLRVWHDPLARPKMDWEREFRPDSWCDKNDLLNKCLRAREAGLDIMVDFHYSDFWADPGKQITPKAWADHSLDEMCQDVAAHTTDVLQMLKDNGISPRWVQIGNETTNGMLWPMGHAKPDSCQNYARLFTAGYEAMKQIFPDAIGIVHLDNGWKAELYDWNIGGLKECGAKFDMIGMSLYPYWAQQEDSTREADQIITDCMANIRRLGEIYQCPVIITEVGFYVDESQPEVLADGRRQLMRVLREAKYETNGICRGVFYWEPECRPSQYRLGAFTEDGHPTCIMEGWTAFEQ